LAAKTAKKIKGYLAAKAAKNAKKVKRKNGRAGE